MLHEWKEREKKFILANLCNVPSKSQWKEVFLNYGIVKETTNFLLKFSQLKENNVKASSWQSVRPIKHITFKGAQLEESQQQ